MLIDIHIHTRQFSTDSSIDPEEAIIKAKESGLDGMCFTDHNKGWDIGEIERLRTKFGYPLFSGVEIDTVEGHILVFGVDIKVDGPIRIAKLRDIVTQAGGFMIAAHPLKGYRVFNLADLNLAPEQAAQRPMMRHVDAIEVYNGKCNERENSQAGEVAQILNLPATGGSDAHSISEIGSCVTHFEDTIKNIPGFLTALKSGRFKAVKR
jgi:predicted metal-dependent phosphoesterase TrpH